jgi:hypothetical protein
MAYYCLGLFLLLTLLFVRTDPHEGLNATGLVNGTSRQHATFAITLILLIESLVTLSREYYQASVLGIRNYFVYDWKNAIDLTLIALT